MSCVVQPKVGGRLGRARMLLGSCMSFPTNGHFLAAAVEFQVNCRSFASHSLEPRKSPRWRKVSSVTYLHFGNTEAQRLYSYCIVMFPGRSSCCRRGAAGILCPSSYRGHLVGLGSRGKGILFHRILFLSCNEKVTELQLMSTAWLAEGIYRLLLGLENQIRT